MIRWECMIPMESHCIHGYRGPMYDMQQKHTSCPLEILRPRRSLRPSLLRMGRVLVRVLVRMLGMMALGMWMQTQMGMTMQTQMGWGLIWWQWNCRLFHVCVCFHQHYTPCCYLSYRPLLLYNILFATTASWPHIVRYYAILETSYWSSSLASHQLHLCWEKFTISLHLRQDPFTHPLTHSVEKSFTWLFLSTNFHLFTPTVHLYRKAIIHSHFDCSIRPIRLQLRPFITSRSSLPIFSDKKSQILTSSSLLQQILIPVSYPTIYKSSDG